MSATPGHPLLRRAVADALAALLERVAAVRVAEWVRCHRGTPAQRGAELAAWPGDALLELGLHDERLADAIIAYWRGEGVDSSSGSSMARAAVVTAGELGGVVQGLIAAAADETISPHEAGELLVQLEPVHRRLEELRDQCRLIVAGNVRGAR